MRTRAKLRLPTFTLGSRIGKVNMHMMYINKANPLLTIVPGHLGIDVVQKGGLLLQFQLNALVSVIMSVDAYIEKQDRTFGTFRSKFILDTHTCTRQTNAEKSDNGATTIDPDQSRSASASPFADLLTSPLEQDDSDFNSSAGPTILFAPQIRRLDIAPWEVVEELSIAEKPIKATRKSSKPRSNIFRKFKRVTAGEASAPTVNNDSATSCHDTLPSSSTSFEEPEVSFRTGPESERQPSGSPSTPHNVSGIRHIAALGRPFDTEKEDSMVFAPVDPNIIDLGRHPRTVLEAENYRAMKPSLSTPQINYEVDSPEQQRDRMSRMFDNLVFV